MTSPRIPPESEDLAFVRHDRTGRVHVEAWNRPRPNDPVRVPTPEERAEAVLRIGLVHTLCGQRLPHTGRTDRFADEDTCGACVRLLGDQSPRAFAHERPGDPEDGRWH